MALEGNGLPWYGEDWSGILLSICGTISNGSAGTGMSLMGKERKEREG